MTHGRMRRRRDRRQKAAGHAVPRHWRQVEIGTVCKYSNLSGVNIPDKFKFLLSDKS